MNNELKYEVRVEVFKITEYRDGCVFKTESLGLQWIPEGQRAPEGMMYCAIGSHAPEALEMNIRKA